MSVPDGFGAGPAGQAGHAADDPPPTSAGVGQQGAGQPDVDPAAEPGPVEAPGTGDERVDATLGELADVRAAPLAEQVERYAGAHRALQDRLADLDG